ncbi:MAG: ABC transporter permease [Spirochaetaceae bacterium]|nr:ABC transporter permease [Spirochaetaceae bacterium]
MSDATGIRSAESAPKRRSLLAAFLNRLVKEKPLGAASGIVILLWILIAIFADALTPYPPFEMHLADRLQGASAQYLLGTDHIGRDFLSRLIIGARISILIGLAATALSTVISTLIGGTSGFLGGKFDIVVQRVVDAWIVFPGLLLLLTIMSIVGRGIPQIILVLGISGGIGGSRLIRSAVIAIKGSDNFLAAEAVGNTKWRSLIRHVLPNVMPVVIITFSITVGGVILSIASLSFLGYGLPPTTPDWGGLLSREGRQYMEQAPWLAVWPGLCLTIAVYCLNMLGDAIRDLLDPRLRGGEGRYGTTGTRKRGLLSRLLNPFS